MLPDHSAHDFHAPMQASWEALGEGGPMLAALATLCARVLLEPPRDDQPLSRAAQAILYAARNRGVMEVRGVRTGFEAPARLLAVYVEIDETRTIVFRDAQRPEVTVRFFEAFCDLCRRGLILHHLHRDFSLSQKGFHRAAEIDGASVAGELQQATEFGLHD